MAHSCACRTQGDLRVGHTGELGDRETRVPPPPPPRNLVLNGSPDAHMGRGSFVVVLRGIKSGCVQRWMQLQRWACGGDADFCQLTLNTCYF